MGKAEITHKLKEEGGTRGEAIEEWSELTLRVSEVRAMRGELDARKAPPVRQWLLAWVVARWREYLVRQGRSPANGGGEWRCPVSSVQREVMLHLLPRVAEEAEQQMEAREISVTVEELEQWQKRCITRWRRGGEWGGARMQMAREARETRNRKAEAVKAKTLKWQTLGTHSGLAGFRHLRWIAAQRAGVLPMLDLSDRPVAKRAAYRRAGAARRQKERAEGRVERGQQGGGPKGDLWQVEGIIRVERPVNRRGSQLDCLVRWKGEDHGRWEGGRGDGESWEESWESVTTLGAYWKQAARQMESDKYDTRDKARTQGATHGWAMGERRRQQARDRQRADRLRRVFDWLARRKEARMRDEDPEEVAPMRKRQKPANRKRAPERVGPVVVTRSASKRRVRRVASGEEEENESEFGRGL